MKILAFESSCDETAVAVVEDGRTILSDAIASQADMHALYGGVVPEIASRKHVEAISGLTEQALREAGCTRADIDAVAVTYAPGLIGAVLVGLSFAKSVAYGWGVPLIPVHHVRGHIAANYLAFPELEPPFLALAISGGNTLLVDVQDYTVMKILGATRDDAAGECFDKAARVLGLPYPGGKPLDELAQQSAGGVYNLPEAHVDGAELDMSFSGLKTAVVNLAHRAEQTGQAKTHPYAAPGTKRLRSGEPFFGGGDKTRLEQDGVFTSRLRPQRNASRRAKQNMLPGDKNGAAQKDDADRTKGKAPPDDRGVFVLRERKRPHTQKTAQHGGGPSRSCKKSGQSRPQRQKAEQVCGCGESPVHGAGKKFPQKGNRQAHHRKQQCESGGCVGGSGGEQKTPRPIGRKIFSKRSVQKGFGSFFGEKSVFSQKRLSRAVGRETHDAKRRKPNRLVAAKRAELAF